MTPAPIDRAQKELDAWQQAMREQRGAERQLDKARRTRDMHTLFALHAQVDALRTRSALLLARAVEKMREDPAKS